LICARLSHRVRGIAMPPHPDQAKWFTEEILPHERVLRAHLRGAFPAVRDVDDVVQESFLRVWRARAAQPVGLARAFLFRVARNLALDLVRRERVSPVTAVADPAALPVAAPEIGVETALAEAERLRLLGDAIAALPPRSRELIVLCKIDGLTHREAAARLGLAPKTVDEHIHRGLRRLGAELRARGLENYF
jgi:RNA polymerase sigma-70 factor (ECF subfamily)